MNVHLPVISIVGEIQVLWNLFKSEMRISFISVSKNVFFLKKPTINVLALMSLQTSES